MNNTEATSDFLHSMKVNLARNLLGFMSKFCRLDTKRIIVCLLDDVSVINYIQNAAVCHEILRTNKLRLIIRDDRFIPLFVRTFPAAEVFSASSVGPSEMQEMRTNDSYDFFENRQAYNFILALNKDFLSNEKPVFTPAPDLTEIWRKRFSALGEGLKIGISWNVNHKADKPARPSSSWKELFSIPGIHWINLQYRDCRKEEILKLKQEFAVNINDWPPDENPIDGLVAQISELDLIISADHSALYFSAAQRIPTWALMGKSGCMWGKYEDSQWSENLRLFHQDTSGEWKPAFERVTGDLSHLIETGKLKPVDPERSYKSYKKDFWILE